MCAIIELTIQLYIVDELSTQRPIELNVEYCIDLMEKRLTQKFQSVIYVM